MKQVQPEILAPEIYYEPPSDWQSACAVPKVHQCEEYGCGVACLSMVAGLEYPAAREIFVNAGMGRRRGGKAPLSTNMADLSTTLTIAGLANAPRKWNGWNNFRGLGIIKVRLRLPGAGKGWHWAVAFAHEAYEVVIFDPHYTMPAFRRMPLNVECCGFDLFEVVGKWIQVENIYQPRDVS